MKDLTTNQQLRKAVSDNLNNFSIREITDHGKKHAAVAVVVTNCDRPANIANIKFDENACDQAAFILTTRSAKLNSHRGQRAFPGGVLMRVKLLSRPHCGNCKKRLDYS
jgi:hypothetical protein